MIYCTSSTLENENLLFNIEVADPLRKDLVTPPGKPSSIKAQRLVRLTCKSPPLKREDGVGRPPWTTA